MLIGVPKESAPDERRVALVPESVKTLVAAEHEVRIETGAGASAGFPDGDYEAAGARVVPTAREAMSEADLVLKVAAPRALPDGTHEADLCREGAALVAFLRPLDDAAGLAPLAARKLSALSIEFMPRITRAQSMDALSSQSTISGYKAVLMAANQLPRIFPMLVTAAGTLKPAKVLVIGAGVAGLQALGTAKRLGAVTSAYDTRAVVAEQVQSMGARFIELDLDTGDSEDKGGYAKAQTEEFYEKQRSELARHIGASDVVITTALVPGIAAPLLITEDAVKQMKPASVIVDLAAANGGNCALTEKDQVVQRHGVTIIGHTNLPSEVPAHASQMYSKNLITLVDHLAEEGALKLDLEDEITAGTLIAHEGKIINARVRELLEGGSGGEA